MNTPKYTRSTTCGSTSSDSSSVNQTFVLASIVEGRKVAKGEIGIAVIDLRHPELQLCEFSDNNTYTQLRIKLQILCPVEILIPDTALENFNHMSIMVDMLKTDLPRTAFTTVSRQHYNYDLGLEFVQRLRLPECSSLDKDLKTKYYCLACASALMKYVEFIQNIAFVPHTIKVTFSGIEKSCRIDPQTARNLELIVNNNDFMDVKNSLYGVLNFTATHGGARTIRSTILQPSVDLTVINQRLDAIEELTANEEDFKSVKSLMIRLIDIDQLVVMCSSVNKTETVRMAEYKITQLIYLKHTLALVDPLRKIIQRFHNPLIVPLIEAINDDRFAIIMSLLREVLHDDTKYVKGVLNMRMQKCFAVKPNVHDLLDIARRGYNELIDDLNDLLQSICVQYGYPFRLQYSASKGYFLELYVRDHSNEPKLPSNFIHVVRQQSLFQCTTRQVIKLNDRITQTVNDILILTNQVMNQLLIKLRPFIGCIYNLTNCISTLDALVSLAQVSITAENYVRPTFGNCFNANNSRHPVLEKVIGTNKVVPNSIFLAPGGNFVIITGPNMAGKSTYLRQVALIQIMAQCGCFVPADYCCVRICSQVFSRIGQSDDVESNSSTFMVEMKDMTYILQNVTEDSLIIIDELGRSTAVDEGIGICRAVCEHLVKTEAFVIFATHFMDLSFMDTFYVNVSNYHFDSADSLPVGSDKSGHKRHALKQGPFTKKIYVKVFEFHHNGFEWARLACFPNEILTRARELVEKSKDQHVCDDVDFLMHRAYYRLGLRFQAILNNEKGDNEGLRLYLRSINDEFKQNTAGFRDGANLN